MKSKVRSQVAVNPNEFLYYQQDSIHHAQLRRSSELAIQDIDYQRVSETGFFDSVATAESGLKSQARHVLGLSPSCMLRQWKTQWMSDPVEG
ncbi:MAG: hypothetical protein P0120_11745 [Nitrospira sp.]|nr:hypothetical protein [Nitrospira sp.]